jgi:hypothetical protein
LNGVAGIQKEMKQTIVSTYANELLLVGIFHFIEMAKEIQLTQGIVTIVDDDDYQYLNQFKWYLLKSHSNYYAIRTKRPENKLIQLHRIVIKAKQGEIVDHINGNKLDNRKCNLRICTKSQNCQNRKISKLNKSGFNGVSWNVNNRKWVAQIAFNNKKMHLGFFNDLTEAAKSFNAAALKYHGEFANLNKID